MRHRTKKILKITGITLVSIVVLVTAVIAVAINFVFTPEKLTPVVLKVANQNLNAKLDMKSVELTFFSTFPRFGVKLTDGSLVSKSIRDSLWQRTDSLLTFKRAVVVVNVVDYLRAKKISLNRLRLDSINLYAYKGKDGVANWDIVASDTVAETDGSACVVLQVSKQSGANEAATAEAVVDTMEEYSQRNSAVRYTVLYSAADYITGAVIPVDGGYLGK